MTLSIDWLALAERCERATGRDYEIEGNIALALGLVPSLFNRRGTAEHARGSFFATTSKVFTSRWDAPAFTGSLDAIVALIEMELPEWYWEASADRCALVRDPNEALGASADHVCWAAVSPAIALSAAFCRAMAARAAASGESPHA